MFSKISRTKNWTQLIDDKNQRVYWKFLRLINVLTFISEFHSEKKNKYLFMFDQKTSIFGKKSYIYRYLFILYSCLFEKLRHFPETRLFRAAPASLLSSLPSRNSREISRNFSCLFYFFFIGENHILKYRRGQYEQQVSKFLKVLKGGLKWKK